MVIKKVRNSFLKKVYWVGIVLFCLSFIIVEKSLAYGMTVIIGGGSAKADNGTTVGAATSFTYDGSQGISFTQETIATNQATAEAAADIINSSGRSDGSALDDMYNEAAAQNPGHSVDRTENGDTVKYSCENGGLLWWNSPSPNPPAPNPSNPDPSGPNPDPSAPNPDPTNPDPVNPNPTNIGCINPPILIENSAEICPGDIDGNGMTSNVSWTNVGTSNNCSSAFCELYCKDGFIKNNETQACDLIVIGKCNSDAENTKACSKPENPCSDGWLDGDGIRAEGTLWKWNCVGNSGSPDSCQAQKECPWIETNQ